MARKVLMEVLPTSIPDLKEPYRIFILTKETKISRGPTIDVLEFTPGFMTQMDFASFNVESIYGFTSTFVDICSTTSNPFGFSSKRKCLPLDILKYIFTTLRKQDKKVSFI